MGPITYDSFRCVSWDDVYAVPDWRQRIVRLPIHDSDHQRSLEWLAQNSADVALVDRVVNAHTFEPMFARVLFYDANHLALFQLAFSG